MNIVDISKKRYTTKHYDKTKKIPAEQIEQLCEVLRNSPSSVNSQPWHFVVVGSDAGKAKILPAISDFNLPRVEDSSHSIVMCVRQSLDEDYLQHILNQEEQDGRFPTKNIKIAQDNGRHVFVDKNSTTAESQFAWKSKQLYIALGNLLFAAAALGIDSTAIEGYDAAKMDEILGLNEQGFTSVVVVSLGYRSENDSNAIRPKSRLPKEELFTFL